MLHIDASLHQRFVREGVCDDTLYLGGCADGDEQ